MKEYKFIKAVPVWEKGKDEEKHYNLIFKSTVSEAEKVTVNLAASSLYQLFVNGAMVAEGPARAGHGYYRVDEIDITRYLNGEENTVIIFVNGYYVANYYLLKQKSFLCAEIVSDGVVTHATGAEGFSAVYNSLRIRKVPQYTRQRTFTEAYNLSEESCRIFHGDDSLFNPVVLEKTGDKRFIERQIPYPSYEYEGCTAGIKKGAISLKPDFESIRNDKIEVEFEEKGFPHRELELNTMDEAEKFSFEAVPVDSFSAEGSGISPMSYNIYEMKSEKTGFIKAELECSEDMQLVMSFDEILTDGDVSAMRGCVNSIVWNLKKGRYNLVTVEPYSLKYLKLINTSDTASVKVENIGIIKYEFDCKVEKLNSGDSVLDMIYDAAASTFRQNSVDIYMDCPSRERAGWLCDSYFTARTEYELTGKSQIEKNFLENFIYTEGYVGIPDGMIPMCYPADFRNNLYIPQWAMWFVLELEAYLDRSGDGGLIAAAKEKVYKLIDFFGKYENKDGLLENLESWSFIEWSKTRDFMDGVHYPSNMLYARMLKAASAMYNDASLLEKSGNIVKTVIEQSYFDGFFHDHALRDEDGKLQVMKDDITETCQYYAFFMETASAEEFPQLWKTLLEEFGPDRLEKGLWENIHPSNAFTGFCLRLELLSKADEREKLLESIRGFYGYMAQETGTLWEHKSKTASCNHGFASQVLVWLRKYWKK